jgi:hypothetical protein
MNRTDAKSLHDRSDSQALARQLPDLADGLRAQLLTLCALPSAPGAEQLAINLEGARRHVLRLGDAILREVSDAAS